MSYITLQTQFNAVIAGGDLVAIQGFINNCDKYRCPLIHNGVVYAFNLLHAKIEVIQFLANLIGLCATKSASGIFSLKKKPIEKQKQKQKKQ